MEVLEETRKYVPIETTVPIDERHRFLDWQPSAVDCYEWSQYLTAKGVDHVIMKNAHSEHTIYKHMASIGSKFSPCCAELAPLSYRQVTGKYVMS